MRENDLYEVASSSLEVVHAMFRESPVENTTHFDRFERSYSPRRSYRVHLYTILLFDDISVQNYKSIISNYALIKAYFSEKQKYEKYGSVIRASVDLSIGKRVFITINESRFQTIFRSIIL